MCCILAESGTDGAECSRKVVSGRRFAGAIRSLINTRNLQLECARVLHETLPIPLFMNDSETIFGVCFGRIMHRWSRMQ